MTLTPERLKEIRDRWNSGHITPHRTVGELLAHIDELEADRRRIDALIQYSATWQSRELIDQKLGLTASAKENE